VRFVTLCALRYALCVFYRSTAALVNPSNQQNKNPDHNLLKSNDFFDNINLKFANIN
jgi:hypothetical protein